MHYVESFSDIGPLNSAKECLEFINFCDRIAAFGPYLNSGNDKIAYIRTSLAPNKNRRVALQTTLKCIKEN
jgi:hypothetical protein